MLNYLFQNRVTFKERFLTFDGPDQQSSQPSPELKQQALNMTLQMFQNGPDALRQAGDQKVDVKEDFSQTIAKLAMKIEKLDLDYNSTSRDALQKLDEISKTIQFAEKTYTEQFKNDPEMASAIKQSFQALNQALKDIEANDFNDRYVTDGLKTPNGATTELVYAGGKDMAKLLDQYNIQVTLPFKGFHLPNGTDMWSDENTKAITVIDGYKDNQGFQTFYFSYADRDGSKTLLGVKINQATGQVMTMQRKG